MALCVCVCVDLPNCRCFVLLLIQTTVNSVNQITHEQLSRCVMQTHRWSVGQSVGVAASVRCVALCCIVLLWYMMFRENLKRGGCSLTSFVTAQHKWLCCLLTVLVPVQRNSPKVLSWTRTRDVQSRVTALTLWPPGAPPLLWRR